MLTLQGGVNPDPVHLSHFFVLAFDRYSYLFLLIVNVSWLLTLIYSSAYLRSQFQEKSDGFHLYLASTLSVVMGAGLSYNFFTLIFFYAASIPLIDPLITIGGDDRSKKAGRYYLWSNMIPMTVLIIPTIWSFFPLFAPFSEISIDKLGYSHEKAGWILALLVLGFAKNCVAPFHLWLPRSSVAPAPVTALIHSVAAVQTAILALLKIGSTV